MATRWCTMEDVQADLARATGQRARAPLLHEGCLLLGERPPPQHVADEECEEEQQLRYGATEGGAPVSVGGTGSVGPRQTAPDLRGITSMIRMYENHGGGGGDSTQHLTKSDEVIVISKPTIESSKREPTPRGEPAGSASSRGLNPNAEDFVPTTSGPRRSEPETGSSEGINTADEPVTNNDTINIAIVNRDRGSEESITDKHRIEREELATMLLNKIQPTPPDCPKLQRDRYAAIAGLLRLHSAPLASPPAPSPTLRTPDYFRTHRAELSQSQTCANRDPELIETDMTAETNTPDATPDDREVRDSISKVSAWLHAAASPSPVPALAPAPAPAAPPQPHLAPLSYRRRKDVATAPSSPTRSPRAPAPAPVRYVPSANALALSETYAARVASVPTPPTSLWDRVVDDLRARDAAAAGAEAEEDS